MSGNHTDAINTTIAPDTDLHNSAHPFTFLRVSAPLR